MRTPTDHSVLDAFRRCVEGADDETDLARAALEIARIERPDVDVDGALEALNARAAEVHERLASEPRDDGEIDRIGVLNDVVFGAMGLRGAGEDYYDPANSCIDQVMERKIGIPVSLSAIYLAIGARAGIALGGASVPMHFLVKVLGERPARYVDCFSRGRMLSVEDCRAALGRITRGRVEFKSEMLEVVSTRSILTRMLGNLKMIYFNRLDYAKALAVLDRMLVLNPERLALLRERGLAHYRMGSAAEARRDLADYLRLGEDPNDADEIRELIKKIG